MFQKQIKLAPQTRESVTCRLRIVSATVMFSHVGNYCLKSHFLNLNIKRSSVYVSESNKIGITDSWECKLSIAHSFKRGSRFQILETIFERHIFRLLCAYVRKFWFANVCFYVLV